jgi:hypothetical protein
MPFGLKNAGATNQLCIQSCFKEQIGRNLEVYIDDIIIETQQGNSLILDLEKTFTNPRHFDIRLNPEKCTFGVPEANLYGTSSQSAASKQILTRSWPSPK